MKTAWLIVIIILLLSLVGNWLQWDLARTKDVVTDFQRSQNKITLQQSRDSLKVITASTDSTRKAEQEIRAEHDKEDSLREVSANRERMASKATIANLQTERTDAGIIPDEHTNRIEAEFQAQQARDSAEIATLKSSATLAAESFQTEIKAVVSNLEAERKTSLKKDVVISDLETQVVQEKRKVKSWKVVAGVIALLFVIDEFRE